MPKKRAVGKERKRQSLGRVANRSKVKKVSLIQIGELVTKPGWHNAGYIFPKGYEVYIDYRKIDDPSTQDAYHCSIAKKDGLPLF
jgi:hypothetical protein